uniref:ALF11 n=1 Tax=Procambarus clarkii TaxID=6728 RepID=A0A1S5RQU4_PROCL|nr:anti-lipopolysaccharide factor-like [Procambarus clarkii]AOG75604.1 ALF11 [Procambarus clarkii]
MRLSAVLSLGVVLTLVVLPAPECHGQEILQSLLGAVTQQLVGLWKNGEVELLGHYCQYSVSPKFKSFELYFRGRMTCPGWTPIRGEAESRSSTGILAATTADFVNKAFQAGLITEDDAKRWLN